MKEREMEKALQRE